VDKSRLFHQPLKVLRPEQGVEEIHKYTQDHQSQERYTHVTLTFALAPTFQSPRRLTRLVPPQSRFDLLLWTELVPIEARATISATPLVITRSIRPRSLGNAQQNELSELEIR
jgi:hypothetical protein